MSYQYSTLRFVPDPARGEAVNLGVIVGDDDTGDWDLRVVSGYRRAKAIDQEARIGTALAFIATLEQCLEETPLSHDTLSAMSSEMNNVVQLSAPAPVVAESAAAALELLFDELIVEPGARSTSQTKWRAVKSTLAAYREHDVPDDAIARRAPIRAGSYETVFDFAVHNGSAVQLVQCWSFQLAGQADLAEQVRSWAWGVRAIQTQGGEAITETAQLRVPQEVEVGAVYVAPEPGADSTAFDEARAAFEDANVLALPADEASVLGEHAVGWLHQPV
jgi:hypothetical protein